MIDHYPYLPTLVYEDVGEIPGRSALVKQRGVSITENCASAKIDAHYKIPNHGGSKSQPQVLSEARLVSLRVFQFDTRNSRGCGALGRYTEVAEDLTRRHGRGMWSTKTSEKGVLYAMRTSRVFAARVGMPRLWPRSTCDEEALGHRCPRYFSPRSRPLSPLGDGGDSCKAT